MHARLASVVPHFAMVVLFALTATASAQWPFPALDGTTWEYSFTREPERDKSELTRRIVPSSSRDPSHSLQLEESSNGILKWTQSLQCEHEAVVATAQRPAGGKTESLNPPATILPANLGAGLSWNFHGAIAGMSVTMPMRILGEEEVAVAAGKFRAWHIRGEQNGPMPTAAEEWFVPGVGSVKEMVTQRSPTGQLIARQTLELKALPTMTSTAPAPASSFEASLSTSTGGTPLDTVPTDALQIVARWRLRHPAGNARLRAVWIAENTGSVASPDYQIDEASAVAPAPEAVGTFVLSRPPDGWAPGKYRVDFYVRNVLTATRRLTIVRRAGAAEPPLSF